MKITAALKAYFVQKGWIKADDSDDVVKAAVSQRLMAGEIDAKTLMELQTEGGGSGGAQAAFQKMIADSLAPLTQTVVELQRGLSAIAGQQGGGAGGTGTGGGTGGGTGTGAGGTQGGGTGNGGAGTGGTQGGTGTGAGGTGAGGAASQADVDAAVQKGMDALLVRLGISGGGAGNHVTPTQLFSRSAQSGWLRGGSPDVKKAIDGYDQTRSSVVWSDNCKHEELRGRRLTAPSLDGPGMGRALDAPSQADKAVIGAWFKWAWATSNPGEFTPPGLRLTDHDMHLVRYAIHELPWTGMLGGEESSNSVDGERLDEAGRKALLDDSTSGGIYAAPQIFDDAVIIQPLLYGELFPLVSVTNLSMGRRIEATTMGRPVFSWGTPEGTATPLFDTTNFIGALDTSIFPAVGSMQIGNDFEEDSPGAWGNMVTSAYGESALETLDKVIAVGDGVNQPLGIFNTSGVVAVSSAGGTPGPLAIGDLEGLIFGLNKPFRAGRGGNRNVFIGNDVSYRRFRSIPVGTGYNTRAFGENYADYTALGFPFKIHANVPNSKLAYVNMAYYQMWRRLGVQIKIEKGGYTLVQANLTLINVRMRYGGRLVLGGAAAVMTDAMS